MWTGTHFLCSSSLSVQYSSPREMDFPNTISISQASQENLSQHPFGSSDDLLMGNCDHVSVLLTDAIILIDCAASYIFILTF